SDHARDRAARLDAGTPRQLGVPGGNHPSTRNHPPDAGKNRPHRVPEPAVRRAGHEGRGMNTPTTNLLDLIRDDAHAAGFQSLGQYRKALVEAATAAATITIGETHSPVKVRLGLRLIGDEEVATITLTQHDRTVTLNCVDQAHAARIAEAIEGTPAVPAGQENFVSCSVCRGKGYRVAPMDIMLTCPHCRGSGICPGSQPAEQQPGENDHFDAFWSAPEQEELRMSCAKGWALAVWKASRASMVVKLPTLPPPGVTSYAARKAASDMHARFRLAITAAGGRVKV